MLKELVLLFSLLFPTITNATTYLCGDSLMVGMSSYFKEYIIDCINISKCGVNISSIPLPKITDNDTIIISLGTNDLYSNKYENKVTTLIQRLTATNARVIWLLPPEMKRKDLVKRLPKISSIIRKVCDKYGVEVIDLYLSDTIGYHTYDGVHYTRKGYKKLVEYVLENME